MSYYLTPDSKNENFTSTPNELKNVTYKTSCSCIACLFFFVGVIVGGGLIIFMIILYIKEKEKKLIYVIIFLIVWTIIFTCGGGSIPFYISFNINTYLGIIKVKTIKLYCCFNKTKTIQINDIQKVLIQKDFKVKYVINGRPVDAIEVIFKLNNEREIKGCSGIMNSNNESNKMYNFLRNALPQNIPIEGNLVSV